jgi:dihydrofolate reductase
VRFHSGDLTALIGELRARHENIWVVGGHDVCAACLRLGLVDDVRLSIVPVLIGEGIPFFGALTADIPLHLAEVKAYRNGMVEMRHEVKRGG